MDNQKLVIKSLKSSIMVERTLRFNHNRRENTKYSRASNKETHLFALKSRKKEVDSKCSMSCAFVFVSIILTLKVF